MNELSSLISSSFPSETDSVQQKSYVTYTLSALASSSEKVPTITLLESRNLLTAGGVTGFRTWEAAFHLGNYLCGNPGLIEGKSILELGAGTAYLSVLCAKYLHASHYLATDGSEDVVSSFSTNIYLNGLQDSSIIDGKELSWGHALVGAEHPEWNAGRSIDLVLGSDLTYDATWHPALIATFREVFDLYPGVKIVLAATVRNETTFEMFTQRCKKNGLVLEHVEYPMTKQKSQEGPFYSDLAPVEICIITRL